MKKYSWVIQVACGCPGYVTLTPPDKVIEIGEEVPCPKHDRQLVVFAATLGYCHSDMPEEWAAKLKVQTVPDYMKDYGFPGIAFSNDGDAIIDFGEGRGKRVLWRVKYE